MGRRDGHCGEDLRRGGTRDVRKKKRKKKRKDKKKLSAVQEGVKREE